MDTAKLSSKYTVIKLKETDIPSVYELCSAHGGFYEHCPPFVTPDSIRQNMQALPPNKSPKDKYYLGFYQNQRLIAVMDLILGFPNDQTAFLGFFMVAKDLTCRGIGSNLVRNACQALAQQGFCYIMLGWAQSNLTAAAFWQKNGFVPTGAVDRSSNLYPVVIAKRTLL